MYRVLNKAFQLSIALTFFCRRGYVCDPPVVPILLAV